MSRAQVAAKFRGAWIPVGSDSASPELLPDRLARACVAALPVSGAGLSLMSAGYRTPLGASDDTASTAERLQFTQGEGPCLDGVRTGRMVVAEASDIEQRWSVFADELFSRTPYRTVVSVPLPITEEITGAFDLYLQGSDELAALSLGDVSAVSDEIAAQLLAAQSLGSAADSLTGVPEPAWLHSPASRRRADVWVAVGMIMSRLDAPATDALAVLRGYAYSRGAVLDDLAGGLLSGSLHLDEIVSGH